MKTKDVSKLGWRLASGLLGLGLAVVGAWAENLYVPLPNRGTCAVDAAGTQGASQSANKGNEESQGEIWNPATTQLGLQLEIYASGNYSLVMDDRPAIVKSGAGCGTPSTPSVISFPELTTHKKHTLTLICSQFSSATLTFLPDTSVELVKKKGLKANVKTFKVLVDGDEQYSVEASGACDRILQTWEIVLKPDQGIRQASESDLPWSRAEENLGENSAAGDAAWPDLGPGHSTNSAVMSFKWGANVGHLSTGREGGQIRLRETNLTLKSFSPISLLYSVTSPDARDLIVVTNIYYLTNRVGSDDIITTNGLLRQMKTPLALADITTNSQYKYFIKFYTTNFITSRDSGTGIFNLTNTAVPYVTYTIESPNSSTNQLRITEQRYQTTNTSDLVYDAANKVWSLKNGTATEYVTVYRTNVVSAVLSNRVECVEYRDSAGTVALKSAEKYQQFSWGWELLTVTNNLGTASPLVTTYDFYSNATNLITEYGKLKSIVYADGSWELRDYYPLFDEWGGPYDFPGQLWHVYRPWLDGPTLPGQANLSNSWVSEYKYDRHGRSTYVSSLVHNHDTANLGEPLTTATRMERFPEGLNYDNNSLEYRTETKELGSVSGYGDMSGADTYTLVAGADMADQPYAIRYTNGVQEAFYYDWGYFDAASRTFTTATTNLVHWRMTSVTGGDPMTYAYGDGPGVHTSVLDGHYIDWSYLVPKQSTKETKIMQDGKVVLRETYVLKSYDANTGEFASELLDQFIQSHDSLGHVTNILRRDPYTGSQRTVYSASWKDAGGNDANLLRSETDEDGVETLYTYDGLRRQKTITAKGVAVSGLPGDIVTTLGYDGYGRKLSQVVSGTDRALTNTWTFDYAGRKLSMSETNGLTTTWSYTNNGLTETATLPGGATQVTAKYLDGRTKSVSGSAVVSTTFTYGQTLESGGQYAAIAPHNVAVTTLGGDAQRWREDVSDLREIRVEEHLKGLYGVITNQFLHDVRGLPSGFARPRLAYLNAGWTGTPDAAPEETIIQRCSYELSGPIMGNTNLVFLDGDHVGYCDPATSQQLIENQAGYETDGSRWWRVSTNFVYLADGSTNRTLQSALKEQLTGLGSTTKSITTQIDADTNTTTLTVTVDRPNKQVLTIADPAQSTLNATNVVVNGFLLQESTPSVAAPTVYAYDSLGRQVQVRNPQGASSWTEYDPATGQVTKTIDFTGQSTSFAYYPSNNLNAGRLWIKTEANGKKTYTDYTARGELQHTWGDVPYPTERKYSQYGDLTNLVTFRSGTSWASATWPGGTGDNTYWNYDAASGYLLSKTDALNRSVTYSYYTNGFQKARTYARGVTITQLYDDYGYQSGVDYSDSTPDVTFSNFNRNGQPRSLSDGTGGHTLVYDHAQRLVGDSCVSGAFSGLSVSNRFDRLSGVVYGRTRVSVHGASATVQEDFGYDTYGRVNSVANGTYSATYGYLPDSDLIQTTTGKVGTTSVLTATRTWSYGTRLQAIMNTVGTAGSPLLGHAYGYDAVNRRTRATLADGSAWNYDYNDRDEVVSGKRAWDDFTPVAGQQFEYAFDPIGNRTGTKAGGDQNGANLRSASYTPNALNQYSSRGVPGSVDVLGAATGPASVTVNGAAAYEKGEYYWKEVSAGNGSAPQYVAVSVVAAQGGINVTNAGSIFAPAATENYSHDNDGNLLSDGRWTYTWDAENRLVSMVANSNVPDAAKRKLEFSYDGTGRRATKKVYNYSGGTYQLSTTSRFLYALAPSGEGAGWDLLAEINSGTTLVRSYTWGLDLSGEVEGAGGIGGLLWLTEHPSGATHFAAYDGNGNVLGLIKSDLSISARYEYGPFGEPIRSTGPLAAINPFRWSTKFADQETDLLYYGYRYYNPATGRWISRDPLGEEGGINLYTFVANASTSLFDSLGETSGTLVETSGSTSVGEEIDSSEAAGALRAGNRIKEFFDKMQDLEDIKDLIMDMPDPFDAFDQLMKARSEVFGKGAKLGGELHHSIPQVLRSIVGEQIDKGLDVDEFTIRLEKVAHRRLHTGRGFGKGGMWNGLWKRYMAKNKNPDGSYRITGGDVKEFSEKMRKFFGFDKLPYQ